MPIVLLAHSDSQRRDTLGAALRAKGFEVRAVGDVEAALDAAAETTPGVLLIEPKLLQDEEFEVQTRLDLRASRAVRILVLAHRADPAEMALFKRHGAGLLAKPPEDVDRLAVTIRVQMEQAEEAAKSPAPWERGGAPAPAPLPEPPKSKKAKARAEKLAEKSDAHKKTKGKDKSDSHSRAKAKVPEPPKPEPPRAVTPAIPPAEDPTEPEAHGTRESPASRAPAPWAAVSVPAPPAPCARVPPPAAPASSPFDDPFAVEGDIDVGVKTGLHGTSAPARPPAVPSPPPRPVAPPPPPAAPPWTTAPAAAPARPTSPFDDGDDPFADAEESAAPAPSTPAGDDPFDDPFATEGDIDDFGAKTSAYDADKLREALEKKPSKKAPPAPEPRETRDKTALAKPEPREPKERTRLSPVSPEAPPEPNLAEPEKTRTSLAAAPPAPAERLVAEKTGTSPSLAAPQPPPESDSSDHLFTQVMEGIEPDGATPTEERPITPPAPPPASIKSFLADVGEGMGPTVLLVDDDPAFRGFLRDSLTENGYVVHTAINASNALRFLKSGITIHLVISDLHMPHMDGFELKHEIDRVFPKPMPFIVVTADTSDEKIQTAAQVGASALVPKPIEDMDAFYAILVDTLKDAGVLKKTNPFE